MQEHQESQKENRELSKGLQELPGDQEIRLFIKQIQKRLAMQRILFLMVLYGAVGALFCLLCNLVILWVPVYAGAWIGFGGFLFLAFLAFIHWLLRLPKEYEAAVAGDRAGLKERLATSLERRGQSDMMSELQRQDTVERIREFSISERITLNFYPKGYAGIWLCLFFALLCALIPTPAKKLAKERHALVSMQKEAVKRIDKAEESIEKQAEEGKLSKGEQKKLSEILDSVKKEIQASESEEELRKAKDRLETKLVKALPEQMSQDVASDLQNLVQNQDLAAEAEFQKQLSKLASQSRTVSEAKEALQDLGRMLSAEQKQNLLDSLNQAMADGELTEQELENALKNLNDANASYTKAQIAQNSQTQQAGSPANPSASPGNASAGKQAGGNQPQSSAAPSPGGENGAGQGSGAGEGDGSGQGGGAGQGSGHGQGGGFGAGYSSGSETGIERAEKAGKAEQVWVPDQEGNDENLTGQKTGSSQNQQKSQTAKTQNAGKKADLDSVSGSYEQKAYSKLQKQKIPDSMENLVKEYFSSLD